MAALSVAGDGWAAEAAKTNELEAVVVTAQKRAERLEEVPMTITAISGAAVADRGVRNLQDIGQLVPAVQINIGGSWTQPAIRGVTTLTTGFQFENNVAVYVDGYYQPNPAFLNTDFGDLKGVEVLKGPQGALYGRNATAGAILISTIEPSKTFTGKLEAKYGTYNDRTLDGYVSGPLSDRLRYSLSAYGRKSDGYYDHVNAAGQKVGHGAPLESASVRAKLEADLTENLTATLGYNYSLISDPRNMIFTNEQYRPASLQPKVGNLYDPFTVAYLHAPKFFGRSNEGTMTLALKTPIGVLTSYTGGAHRALSNFFDFDATPAGLSINQQHYLDDTYQEGVDYNIDAIEKLHLVVGGTYFYDRLKLNSYSGSGNTFSSYTKQSWSNKAWGVFADAEYHLTDKLSIGAGGRYTEETRLERNAAILLATRAFSAPPVNGAKATFNNFSPRASIRYEIEPGTDLYASISKGFKSGQLQVVNTPTGPISPAVLPEKITAYEAGFKTARSRVQFDLSGWYYDYTNLQVGLTLPNPLCSTCGPINLISNAPKAVVYGVEGQATVLVVDNLEMNVGAAWTHARYKQFGAATGIGFNATTMLNVPSQIQNWTGIQMARAPTFTANLGANYTIQDVMRGSLKASLNVKYTSSYVLNNVTLYGPLAGPALANQQRYRQSAYSLVNASLNWTDASGHYKAGVWANNIFDKKYHLSRNGNVFGDYGIWAWPRQVGATVGYNF